MICNPVIAGGASEEKMYKITSFGSQWFPVSTAKAGERIISNNIVDGVRHIIYGADGNEIPRLCEEVRPDFWKLTFIMPNQDVTIGI